MDPRERSVLSGAGAKTFLRWMILPAFLLGCGALSYALSAALFFVADVEHVVAVVNPTDRAITIRLDGGAPIVVPPRGDRVLRPAVGAHQLAIEDLGATRTEGFTITGGRSPMMGYRGAIALADTAWVIVARDGSGMDAPDRARVRPFVPDAPGLFAIPEHCDAEIPNLVFYPGMSPVASVWGHADLRLCTYETATRTVGCALCDDASRCNEQDRSGEVRFVLESDPR